MASFNKKLVRPDLVLSKDVIDRQMMGLARGYACLSSDWWRQVGAVAVAENGKGFLAGCNAHLPTEYTPYIDGDPRSNFDAGMMIELSTAQHAEKQIIALAARDGIPLKGCSLYVTTFPCRSCAQDIAQAGFKRLYFQDGYSQLDADEILRIGKVELIQVSEEV